MTFEEYLEEQTKESIKLNYNYLGISKKEYPKWNGWKLIAEHRQSGTPVDQIVDYKLNLLVENFHFIQYLQHHVANPE